MNLISQYFLVGSPDCCGDPGGGGGVIFIRVRADLVLKPNPV